MALLPLKVFILLFSLYLLFILSGVFFNIYIIYVFILIKRNLKGQKKKPTKNMDRYFLSPLGLS